MKQKRKNNPMMDYTKNILPVLWSFLETRRNSFSISINICTIDGELIISIITSTKVIRFKHTENMQLAKNLNAYLKSC